MHNLHPLHLPEIRFLIAYHLDLDTGSLHACTLFNHAWHASFTPHLWRSAHLTSRGPNLNNISSQHTRHLTVDSTLLTWPDPPVLSRLASITFHVDRPTSAWTFLTILVNNQAITGTLTSVALGNYSGPPAFWSALAHCHTLRTVHLQHLFLPYGIAPYVHKLFSMLETLELDNVSLSSATAMQYNAPLMRLKHLRMRSLW